MRCGPCKEPLSYRIAGWHQVANVLFREHPVKQYIVRKCIYIRTKSLRPLRVPNSRSLLGPDFWLQALATQLSIVVINQRSCQFHNPSHRHRPWNRTIGVKQYEDSWSVEIQLRKSASIYPDLACSHHQQGRISTLSILPCPQGRISWSTPCRKIDYERMSVFHQSSGGIRKYIPSALKISHELRPREIYQGSGNLSGVGYGCPNTYLVLVEHGYNDR